MPITTPTVDDMTQAAQDLLTSSCGITNFSSGSVAGTIVGLIVNYQAQLYSLLNQAESARNIDTAQGTDLDNLARAFGVSRMTETTAGADTGAAQLLVTNTTGASLTLTAASAVWSANNPGNRYYTDSSITIPPASSMAVHVQAGLSGIYQNAATGSLNATNGPSGLVVNNFLPIVGGGGAESDEELRYRLAQTIQTALVGGASSAQAIENTLRSLPSVSDVILQPGTGTLNVVVIPADGYNVDDDYLSSVQEVLAGVVAVGVSTTVQAPTILYVDADVSMTVSGDNLTPLGSLQTLIQTVVQNYLNTRQVYVTARPGQSNRPSVGDTVLNYTDLLGLIQDTAMSQLGSKLQNVSLMLSTGSGETAIQGNIQSSDGQVIRSRSVRVTATSSN